MPAARVRGWLLSAVVIVATAGLAGAVGAQTARPAATLDDLLAELRALRTDINQVTAAGIRAQLLATRLSLQEQRIRAVADQMAQAQRTLGTAASERSAQSTHLQQLEDLRREGNVPSAQMSAFDAMLTRLRQEVAQAGFEEQTLRRGEQDLRKALATEQGAWMDFNARLDELERSLPASRRP
jgi:chromosome segregation ATPase